MTLKSMIKSDLDVFIDVDEFGEEVDYSPVGEDTRQINVIWDDVYKKIEPVTGVDTGGISVTAKTGDIQEPAKGGRLTKDGVTYNIIGSEPDGTGITILRLSED